MTRAGTAVFVAVAIATGCYYEWSVRATGYEFEWQRNNLGGYYNYLARGFTEGHLYLPVEPDARLLALPDPLDPNAGPDLPKLFDAVLFDRHYYLYHGSGPAALLFVPWLVLSGHDLPEGFALFLLCLGGYLFSAGALVAITEMAGIALRPWVLAVMLVALGFCQSVPFLLSRVWVYEVAIGGGYFCVAAGLFFLVRSLRSARRVWPAAAGLMLGTAVACRPHLIVVAGFALVALAFALRRRVVDFVVPLAAVGALICLYNYERFGNAAEFGLRYQITGAYQGTLHLRAANIVPGLYYMLLARPEFSGVFPWVLIPWPPRSVPRPPLYFIEPIVGALFLAPFLPTAFAALFMRRLGVVRWVLIPSACAVLLFLVTTGLSTQRYEVDFLPWLVLGSMTAFAVWIGSAAGSRRAVLCAALAGSVAFGLVVGIALGITGPYDDLRRNKPARFVAIAQWFSPAASLRPRLNPPVSVDFAAPVAVSTEHLREDLFVAGRQPLQYELFLDHLNGKPVLVSKFGGTVLGTKEMEPGAGLVRFHVWYEPDRQEMVVLAGGAEVFRDRVETLIAAPVEIVAAGGPK